MPGCGCPSRGEQKQSVESVVRGGKKEIGAVKEKSPGDKGALCLYFGLRQDDGILPRAPWGPVDACTCEPPCPFPHSSTSARRVPGAARNGSSVDCWACEQRLLSGVRWNSSSCSLQNRRKAVVWQQKKETTQLWVKCVSVTLILYNKYSLLFGIRDGFPEEVT